MLDGERVLDVGGGKQRGVLALLLLHANEVVSSDRLIEGLWPEQQPPSAAKIIQAHISRLRKALAVPGDGILLTCGNGYQLRVEPGQLDVDRFRRLLDEGRTNSAQAIPKALPRRSASALPLRGPPLADFAYDSFAQEEIARLEDLHLAALEERIDADLALGRHDDVLPELEHLVRRHPLRERLRGQLMLALYRADAKPRRSTSIATRDGRWQTSSAWSRAHHCSNSSAPSSRMTRASSRPSSAHGATRRAVRAASSCAAAPPSFSLPPSPLP